MTEIINEVQASVETVNEVRKAGQASSPEKIQSLSSAEVVLRLTKFTRVDFGGEASPIGPLKALLRSNPEIAGILEKLSVEEQTTLGNTVFDVCKDQTASCRKRINPYVEELKRRLGVVANVTRNTYDSIKL